MPESEGIVVECKVIPHFGNGYDYMDDPDRFYQSNVAEIQLVAPSLMGIAEVCSYRSAQQWHRCNLLVTLLRKKVLACALAICCPWPYTLQAELEKLSMKLVGNKACVPMRSSYVADLRKYTLQGNLTLDDATYNTTRKVCDFCLQTYCCQLDASDRMATLAMQHP